MKHHALTYTCQTVCALANKHAADATKTDTDDTRRIPVSLVAYV